MHVAEERPRIAAANFAEAYRLKRNIAAAEPWFRIG